MTTVLFTQDYLAADRAVSLSDMVISDTKVRTIKGRVAYFYGAIHPTEAERVHIERAIYAFIFGKENSRSAAIEFLRDTLENGSVIFIMTRKKSYRIMMSGNPILPPDDRKLVTSELDLRAPISFGSGGELAKCGWACGMKPEDIILLVSKIDPMTGNGCVVVYREDLRQ